MDSSAALDHPQPGTLAPTSFGAHVIGPQRVRFAVWAPSKRAAEVMIEGRAPIPMEPGTRGWYAVEVDCEAGARYRYRFDGALTIADPASRYQPDDVHGPSVVVDADGYPWVAGDWIGRPWEETIFYEVHVGAMGGYRGVMAHLPRIAALGITAIELMPINEFSGSRNWGYDGALIYAPEASYGTPNELRALIDAAHGLGLSVFLDVVYNHFGPEGNYLGEISKPFFKDGVSTPWGPAIDFARMQVRDFFYENAAYWINEFRFDGLRIDAAHAIGDTGWLRGLARYVREHTPAQRHVHIVLENEHNQASLLEPGCYDAQWNDDAHNTLHVLLTGETDRYYAAYADQSMQKLARVLKEGFVFQGDVVEPSGSVSKGEPSAGVPATAFVMFLQNHDQVGNRSFGSRIISLANVDALRAATAMLLLSPQIPLLFMGEDGGLEQPFLYFTDYEDTLADAVRRGRHAEFALLEGRDNLLEAIPDPNASTSFALSSVGLEDFETEAARAWQDFYRAAIAVRRRELFPRLKGARALDAQVIGDASSRAVCASWTLADGSVLTIALNLGSSGAEMSMPAGRLLFEVPEGAHRALGAGQLAPHACVVLMTGLT